MLAIKIDETEIFDETTNEFHYIKACTLNLEHSLISVSKWESKWKKSFIPNGKLDKRTDEEMLDYVRCMTLNQNVDPNVYKCLKKSDLKTIADYINDPMTASKVTSRGGSRGRGKMITSELIYCWMAMYQLPFEVCEKWHLNRLLMLIKICNVENSEPKKMSTRDVIRQNAAINAARRAQLHSKG